MAETTTAIWLPLSASRFTRPATWRIPSMPAIEVPPNFITMRAMKGGCGPAGNGSAALIGGRHGTCKRAPRQHHRPQGSRAFRADGGGLVEPQGLVRDAASDESRAPW